jgi:N-acetyl-anhydromuramyl-L-alanine amidase AmpD
MGDRIMATRRELLAVSALACAGACTAPRRRTADPDVPDVLPGVGESIVAFGRRFPIRAPVVLWTDPGGYDAYSEELAFPEDPPAEPAQGLRFAPGRKRADGRVVTISAGIEVGREVVDQLVLHYDAAGTSRACFRILHDVRKLSSHFLVDLDGTIYQTLDLAETAWHARSANPRSVGIEIANIGAWPPGETGPIDAWYAVDERGARIRIPAEQGDGGVRMQDFVGRPARPQLVHGTIQGQELVQYDFTPEQHLSIARLAAGVTRAFPRIALDAPRYPEGHAEAGEVRREVLSEGELASFRGILGHYHVSADKVDPGPAFDWESFLVRLARERAHSLA